MNTPTPPDDHHPVDDLVREHLEREAAMVDAPQMLARVRTAQQTPSYPSRSWALRWATAGGVGFVLGATAASLFLLNIGSSVETPVATAREATPAELVKAAFLAHMDDTDRLYEVKVERGNFSRFSGKHAFGFQNRPITFLKDSKLWVRGNQFWIDPGPDNHPRGWGRDREGRVWVAIGPRLGIQYAKDEESEWLSRYCNLMSLRIPILATEMLEGYDLTRPDPTGGANGPVRIVGVIRNGPREFAASHVTLELDTQTKIIRKAVQKRTFGGEVFATFTYTLIETGHIPDEQYDLSTHMPPEAHIVDPNDNSKLAEMLSRFPLWRPKKGS